MSVQAIFCTAKISWTGPEAGDEGAAGIAAGEAENSGSTAGIAAARMSQGTYLLTHQIILVWNGSNVFKAFFNKWCPKTEPALDIKNKKHLFYAIF